ncbi:hypothetical protein ACFW2Y_20635 [Streptomyces sp. NPDC058877]|uniref:hypothetical protein n=1 Tax=unclassified Streptomyces TaxID=2593676 RepID=UPI0036C2B9AD
MPVDPYAVLQALVRAEASRARRAERTAPEPGTPAPAPASEPATGQEGPARREGPRR